MARYDVAVIGAGPAGLVAAGLLAKEGRSVVVLERSEHLGGRSVTLVDEGYKLNLGSRLLEDSGSGITRILEQLGKQLPHGSVNSEMPVWESGTWKSIRDGYSGSRGELKKAITALMETPYEALDAWDDRPLREWILQHTHDEGVIALWEYLALLECLTDRWVDHAGLDNLFMRKLITRRSTWPASPSGPRTAGTESRRPPRRRRRAPGGGVRMRAQVQRVLIEDGEVKGVAVRRGDRVLRTTGRSRRSRRRA